MRSLGFRLSRYKVFALVLLGAVFYGAAFPPLEWAPLAWFAPVVWLVLLQGRTARERFWLMFAVGYLGTALVVHWLSALFSTMSLLLWMVPATYFGLWGLTAGLMSAENLMVRIAWPALSWAALEFLKCELAPLAFSFGGLGYSQANWLGFNLSSILGVYGTSAVMVLMAAFVIEAWKRRIKIYRVPAAGGLAAVSAISLITPDGSTEAPGADAPKVLLQQLKQDNDIGAWSRLPARSSNAELDLIVWPELTFFDDPRLGQSSWFIDMMKTDATAATAGVLFGAVDYYSTEKSRGGPYHNSIFFLNNGLELNKVADKNQPIQLMNDGDPADDVSVIKMPNAEENRPRLSAGVGICYDGCFQQYSRRMVAKGADFLVFPAMNLESWGKIQHRQHQRMFQMRAAETGRSVLVAAVSGPTFAADPGGSIAEEAPLHRTVALKAAVRLPLETLFNYGGWVFGYLCLGGYFAALLTCLVRRVCSRSGR